MKHARLPRILLLSLLLCVTASAEVPAHPRPPVGVPADAQWHNGRWYRVMLAKIGWKRARDKCRAQGGRLAVIPDEPTQQFIGRLANGLQLWLGASDEKVEKLWTWVDGTPMRFTAWAAAQPDNTDGIENYLQTFDSKGRWNDGAENDRFVVGYICEWPGR